MELQEINPLLIETRIDLLETLKGLSKEKLNFRRSPESWSISQVCQHLVKTEELYLVAIKRGLKSKEDSILENKPVEFLLDRSNKLEAPEIAKPTDEALDYQEIIEKLRFSREKLYEFLHTLEDQSVLSRRQFVHPVFQEMLLIDWIRSLYLHEKRHIKQIQEMKEFQE